MSEPQIVAPADFERDYFALFGLPVSFRIDETALQARWHRLQTEVHPDRFAHLSDVERRRSMQWATRVNEAFTALRDPVKRALYLLELAGAPCDLETNTAMAPDFLIEQLTWREAVEAARHARDETALEAVHTELNQSVRQMLVRLEQDFDVQDYPAATDRVRRLMFIEKLRHEVDEALEALES